MDEYLSFFLFYVSVVTEANKFMKGNSKARKFDKKCIRFMELTYKCNYCFFFSIWPQSFRAERYLNNNQC